jgi:hypothetical protein
MSADRKRKYEITPAMNKEQKEDIRKNEEMEEKDDWATIQKMLHNIVYERVEKDFYMFKEDGWMKQ